MVVNTAFTVVSVLLLLAIYNNPLRSLKSEKIPLSKIVLLYSAYNIFFLSSTKTAMVEILGKGKNNCIEF